jgi:hypothetical protein
MPFVIGKIQVPHNGVIYVHYDPLSGQFAASRSESCPPCDMFKSTFAAAFAIIDPTIR